MITLAARGGSAGAVGASTRVAGCRTEYMGAGSATLASTSWPRGTEKSPISIDEQYMTAGSTGAGSVANTAASGLSSGATAVSRSVR